MFQRFFARTIRRLVWNSRERSLRAGFETLEPRSMLSLAPADQQFYLDIDRLPRPDISDIVVVPIRPIAGIVLPQPPEYPSLPPPIQPDWSTPLPTPPDEFGGWTEIDNADKGQPNVMVEPAADKVVREVLQMLDSLRYTPSAHDSDATSQHERRFVPAPDISPARATSILENIDADEGGMIALTHDAVIMHTFSANPSSPDNIDTWLNTPVRMDSAPSKFQAFEVSTSDDTPPSPAPPSASDSLFFEPPISRTEPAQSVPRDSTLQPSHPQGSDPAVCETTAEAMIDFKSAPVVPPDANHRSAISPSAAVAAIFAFLAARAVRAARSNDNLEAGDQKTLMGRRPTRK